MNGKQHIKIKFRQQLTHNFSLLFLLFFIPAIFIQAQNTTWNGNVSNLWSNPANWSNGVPQPGSNVTIPWLPTSAYQPHIDINTTFNRLTMNSNPNTLTATDGVYITVLDKISIGNSATLDVGNATLTVHGKSTTGSYIKLNNGTINFLGNFSFQNGGVFTVQIGTINIGTSNTSAKFSLGGGNTFNLNNGTFNVYGTSSFAGSGVFNVDQGSANFYDDCSFGGATTVNAGQGEFFFDSDVTIAGGGNINAENSTFIMNGATWNHTGGGTFDPGNSTFILTGDTEITGKDITFYNLIVEEGADVTSNVNVLVLNDMIVDEDGFFVVVDGKTLNVIGEVIGDPYVNTNRPYIITIFIDGPNMTTAVFNEELTAATAQNASNYRVEDENGNTIDNPASAVLSGGENNEVTLTLGFTIQEETNYYLITNNVRNLTNQAISNNHTKRFGIIPNPNVWVWTGFVDKDWIKPGNWNRNLIPAGTSLVTIPPTTNDPVIYSSSVTVNTLTIETGASLTVSETGNLSVTGNLANNAGNTGLVIASSSLGTGSLKHNQNDVTATFQRYISGEPQAWHMLSSPLTAQSISPEFTPSGTYGDGTGYDFYHWHEPDTSWIYYNQQTTWGQKHGNNLFHVGRGYLVSYQEANPTKSFTGTLNTGNISMSVTKSTGIGLEFGFNLAGNPYPASIDWKSATGWERDALAVNAGGYDIWIWNDAEENYGVYNSAAIEDVGSLGVTRYIAPTQGFFVSASQNGTLVVNNDAKAHEGSGNWLKKNTQVSQRIQIRVSPENSLSADEVVMEFGHVKAIDGTRKKFSFISTAPSLYLPASGEKYSLRLFSEPSKHPVIPVSFMPGTAGMHVLHVRFNPGHFDFLLLEDLKTGAMTDLLAYSAYYFTAGTNDEPKRFVIHLKEGNFANPHDVFPVRIYSHNKTIYTDLQLIEPGKDYSLDVVDLAGRIVFSRDVPSGQITGTFLNLLQGIYIVRINGEFGRAVQKIIF
jgi:hypothetical protein